VREIRTLRVMWRGLETGSRGIPELPRQFPTLPKRKNHMLQASPLKRYFAFQGLKLPDPDPQLTAEEVRSFYSTQYPDLATASITGPEAVDDKLVFRFERAIGTKG